MEWQDNGNIIAVKRYGDKNLILSLLTQNYGKRRGLVRSNSNKFQISNLLYVEWRSRLLENLGFFKCELIESSFHYFFHDRLKSIAVVSISNILDKVLPEGESYSLFYNNFQQFIEIVKYNNNSWYIHYLKLELLLLSQLGFELDLFKCAVTGSKENLDFISPKTGRAISQRVGNPYSNKLLPFPRILRDIYTSPLQNDYLLEDFQLGLKICGYFLNKYLFSTLNLKLPSSRELMMSLS
ncbi:MAG: DNA repair protein RecO [Wolbachia endosymbiont of Fragariocoptes setiger]|nr:DNA repair protein RecO [Wolbachia endosymbiont of Fragariocoptes setiger]